MIITQYQLPASNSGVKFMWPKYMRTGSTYVCNTSRYIMHSVFFNLLITTMNSQRLKENVWARSTYSYYAIQSYSKRGNFSMRIFQRKIMKRLKGHRNDSIFASHSRKLIFRHDQFSESRFFTSEILPRLQIITIIK